MKQTISHAALVVRDYDEAIAFFTRVMNFDLVEDTYVPEQSKRWVLVAPRGSRGTSLLLARSSNPAQEAFVGNQTGGRVTFFLETDDFQRDYVSLTQSGVEFVRPPSEAPYGTVAVFKDLYGNLWDLIQKRNSKRADGRAAATITYEVTATVQLNLVDRYEAYMHDHHIPDLLATGCFVAATFSRSESGRYRIRYEAHDQRTLDTYLSTRAPSLRANVEEEFGDGVSLSREIWTILNP